MATQLELDDIQALIPFAHRHLPQSCFLFLALAPNAAPAHRIWLARTAADVATSAGSRASKPHQLQQIAFSAAGLRALGLPDEVMATFLEEFRAGMAEPERARILGDVLGSAPEGWDFGGPTRAAIHCVLMLYARDEATLAAQLKSTRAGLPAAGLIEVAAQRTAMREDGKEPFGFRDGISQPAIAGLPGKAEGKLAAPGPDVSPGEFIFGYPNAYAQLPFSPTVPAALDPKNVLPSLPDDSARRDLGRNGSYLVIRKLEQDVAGFWQFMRAHTAEATGPYETNATMSSEDRARWLAARFMGRWPSGAPVATCPAADDEAVAEDPARVNNFGFHADPHGLRCPIAAHVRRTNPRDAVADKTAEESFQLTGRHRLLRRGRPYRDGEGQGAKEGIMFVAINTNIRRQFEFIQHTWVNNPKFGGLYDTRDPVVGANHEPGGDLSALSFTMVIPGQPLRTRVVGIPRFVQTRGGGYFFLPGRRALQFLAGL